MNGMCENREGDGCEYSRQNRLEIDMMKKKVESIESKAWTIILIGMTTLGGIATNLFITLTKP